MRQGGTKLSNKIHITCKKKKESKKDGVVKISSEAYNIIVELYNESRMTMRDVVSEIIIQAYENGMISLDKEDA